MCDKNHRFIYEVSPIFGCSLTLEEVEYWSAYNVLTQTKVYQINISDMDFDGACEELTREITKRMQKPEDK